MSLLTTQRFNLSRLRCISKKNLAADTGTITSIKIFVYQEIISLTNNFHLPAHLPAYMAQSIAAQRTYKIFWRKNTYKLLEKSSRKACNIIATLTSPREGAKNTKKVETHH